MAKKPRGEIMHIYTLLNQDGTTQEIHRGKKFEYDQLRDTIGGMIEIIPRDYYPEGMKGTVFGHEEARFDSSNHRNPHMLVLQEWDTVGNLLLEQTEKQHNKWIGV